MNKLTESFKIIKTNWKILLPTAIVSSLFSAFAVLLSGSIIIGIIYLSIFTIVFYNGVLLR